MKNSKKKFGRRRKRRRGLQYAVSTLLMISLAAVYQCTHNSDDSTISNGGTPRNPSILYLRTGGNEQATETDNRSCLGAFYDESKRYRLKSTVRPSLVEVTPETSSDVGILFTDGSCHNDEGPGETEETRITSDTDFWVIELLTPATAEIRGPIEAVDLDEESEF